MDNTGSLMMAVRWESQLREITINLNDDINAIKRTIGTIYQLPRVNQLDQYQIQYFDAKYQKFMDLYPGSLEKFRLLLQTLLSSEAAEKKRERMGVENCLKICSNYS